MAGFTTKNFRLYNSLQFKEAFGESKPSRMYVAVGRVQPWNDENNPPDFVDTVANTTYNTPRSFYAAKKVTLSDISFVTDRYNWKANTVYEEYRDNDKNLYDNQFYVLTEDRNVYKCLFNNEGNQSTEKPTGTSTSIIRTSDNYVWKYMYSVSAAESLKFLTQDYMPIKILRTNDGSGQYQVQQTTSNGSIEIVDVLNTGQNYLTNAGTIEAVTNSTFVTLSNTASATSDIYNTSSLYIDGGKGAGQISKIVNYDGINKTVKLGEPFSTLPNTSSTYSVAPSVEISGDGTSATAYSNVASGGVTSIIMINSGENYSYANVSITANSGSGALATPYLSPIGGHGANSYSELAGHNVMLNVKLSSDEANTIPLDNDFRVVALITDPIEKSGNFANSVNYDLATTLVLSSISGTFENDEFVLGQTSDVRGRVVQYSNNTVSTGELRVNENIGKFNLNETITGQTSGAFASVDSFTEPDLKIFDSNVLYVDNRVPVTRSSDQTEDIKLTVKF